MANKLISVLGFSDCGIPTCDCGARVVLGMQRDTARALKRVLEREGFMFYEPPVAPDPKMVAANEPFYRGAVENFNQYVKRPQ